MYLPEVTEIMGGNNTGQLIGSLILDEPSEPTKAIYLIDPMDSKAVKVGEVDGNYEITNASLDNEWVVWVAKTTKQWQIYAKKVNGENHLLVESGRYTSLTGNDFPSAAVDKGHLVYNDSLLVDGTMVSRVVFHDLATRERMILQEVKGNDDYLGAPSIWGRYVVWHWGEWRIPTRSRVFLYDLTTKKMRQINVPHQAISPKVWGKTIAYVGYDSSHQETKNIFLYDIESNQTEQITEAEAENLLEHWAPTIVAGIVTWRTNNAENPISIYVKSVKHLRYLGPKGHANQVTGSWFTWKEPSEGSGTFLFGLVTSLGFILDLSNKEQTVDTLPLDEITPQRMSELNPPEVWTVYLRILQEKRLDLLPLVISSDWYSDNYKEYLEDITEKPLTITDEKVSSIYLAEGNNAVVLVESEVVEQQKGKAAEMRSTNVRVIYENGKWVVPPLASQ
jgi:hypothetical protein